MPYCHIGDLYLLKARELINFHFLGVWVLIKAENPAPRGLVCHNQPFQSNRKKSNLKIKIKTFAIIFNNKTHVTILTYFLSIKRQIPWIPNISSLKWLSRGFYKPTYWFKVFYSNLVLLSSKQTIWISLDLVLAFSWKHS